MRLIKSRVRGKKTLGLISVSPNCTSSRSCRRRKHFFPSRELITQGTRNPITRSWSNQLHSFLWFIARCLIKWYSCADLATGILYPDDTQGYSGYPTRLNLNGRIPKKGAIWSDYLAGKPCNYGTPAQPIKKLYS